MIKGFLDHQIVGQNFSNWHDSETFKLHMFKVKSYQYIGM